MEADFSGYATKAGLKCSDGRTILPDAFRDQHAARVPLVWQHGHTDPENVLGHAILENRKDGVYAYGFFNDSPKAQAAKEGVKHGDINMLSIWANNLLERSSRVMHGVIREVSLVLSGANPGAVIDPVSIRHSDGREDTPLEDTAVITTGLFISHSSEDIQISDIEDEDENNDNTDENPDLQHADGGELTVQEIYEGFSDEEKQAVHYLIGTAVEAMTEINSAAHGNMNNQEGNPMHNVFEGDKKEPVIAHDAMNGIVENAQRLGSMKAAVEAYGLQHGIENIGTLFPDAKALSNQPELFGRRMEWVDALLSGTRKSPFSRIKSLWADITGDEARAKGYITGALKKEEFFTVAKRITTPTTIYKKQALDRDDIVDITDFDVVVWLKAEMRLMLDEEIARAVLVGDGRDISHEDKINEQCIRPIATDHELYTHRVYVNINDANSTFDEVITAVIKNRKFYRGTGQPIFFTSEDYIADGLLLKDGMGRRLYRNLEELAAELRVSKIVPVEILEEYPDIVGILVNPHDYNIGADRGGEVNMFDDFDIDYNKYKYLIEGRMSGALVKLKSAQVLLKVAGGAVLTVPTAPTYDEELGQISIPTVTGVVYKNAAGTTLTTGSSPYTVTPGTTYEVFATPSSSSYYFENSEVDNWEFHRHA
ncbi:hypothetical protein [uncultured Gordonia sp.]|uniref:hypothetical protein n=1 Tax=uncultured Gordonia sp. TaxID=198437 RepID=UPI00263687E9|nr:hypothetical protein [uncultured Gordonia sp.]